MNTELEALLKVFDAFMQARGSDAERLEILYESRLEDTLARHQRLSKESLHRTVLFAYRNWLKAQKQPPSLSTTIIFRGQRQLKITSAAG